MSTPLISSCGRTYFLCCVDRQRSMRSCYYAMKATCLCLCASDVKKYSHTKIRHSGPKAEQFTMEALT
ncbi:hypothetical protein VNO77_43829 [Canavalia gladiata]|uniref:Uncharacterized protein n=1 Tax=Canavalia gladiata TaxID=3824 RepID=A0AAN9PPT2_CANGL